MIISIILSALGALISIGNYGGIISSVLDKRKGIDRNYSCIPLFSLFFCLLAFFIATDEGAYLYLIPAILDPGTWMLLTLPWVLFINFKKEDNKSVHRTANRSR